MADSDSPILEVLSTPQEQFTHLMAFSALLVMADVQQKHSFCVWHDWKRVHAPVWPKGNVLWMMDVFYSGRLEQKFLYSLLTVGLWSAVSPTALAKSSACSETREFKVSKIKTDHTESRGVSTSPHFIQVRASTTHTRSSNTFCTA